MKGDGNPNMALALLPRDMLNHVTTADPECVFRGDLCVGGGGGGREDGEVLGEENGVMARRGGDGEDGDSGWC